MPLYFTRDYTTHDHRFLSALAQTEHQVFYLRLETAAATRSKTAPLPAGDRARRLGRRAGAGYAGGMGLRLLAELEAGAAPGSSRTWSRPGRSSAPPSWRR